MSALGIGSLGSAPLIIDDTNYSALANEVADPNQPELCGGYDVRLYDDAGLASVCNGEWNGEIFPESQWPELIRFHEENNSSPDHHHIASGCKILNQRRTNYCWIHGPAGAMQVALAQAGYDPPHLSAAATGALIKRGRNVGGWGAEAIDGIVGNRYGMPTVDVYPEGTINLNLARSERVRRSAAVNDELEFLKLPRERDRVPLQVIASVLLNPHEPMPISTGFAWWGHLTFHSKFGRDQRNRWGCINVNSWGERWGNGGKSFIAMPKCLPDEGIAIRRVKHREQVA
ncbi:MAG: hypothetical protein AAFP90_06685 [Planctomycetota bacterium]